MTGPSGAAASVLSFPASSDFCGRIPFRNRKPHLPLSAAFSFIILIYWVIIELFTFFFRITGLTADRARFQVISLLTGTGFTTRESELILSSRRRRLAMITMLFGYVFNITIVSAFINVFLSMKLSQVSHHFLGFLIPLGTVALIFILVDNIGTESIVQVKLRHIPEEYKGISLAATHLRAETGILVMLVERKGEKPAAPHADTVFEVGDNLTVFGNYNTICKTFHAREHFADD